MPRLFVEFWRLRQYAGVDEAVRGGSRRRHTGHPWPLPVDVRERMCERLEPHGFDGSREVIADTHGLVRPEVLRAVARVQAGTRGLRARILHLDAGPRPQ
jgi:hypothetical protein